MVPKGHAEQLKDSLADGQIAVTQPTTQLAKNSGLTGGSSYKVRSGDTLSGIAKRLNVKTSDLQSWNNLRAKSAIKLGKPCKWPAILAVTAVLPIRFVKVIRLPVSHVVTASILTT